MGTRLYIPSFFNTRVLDYSIQPSFNATFSSTAHHNQCEFLVLQLYILIFVEDAPFNLPVMELQVTFIEIWNEDTSQELTRFAA